jgi:OPT oligopeptide transporter protein
MLVYSFVEVTVSSRHAFYKLGVSATSGFGKTYRDFVRRNDPNYIREIEDDNDPAPLEDRVPTWAWTSGLLLSVVLGCALCTTQFHMNVGEVILALILGFLLSFLAVQSAGDTDINPVSTVAKATQLIFGGIGKGKHMAAAPGQTLNLVAGVIAGASAAQASDMTGDLKVRRYVCDHMPRIVLSPKMP